MVLIYIFLSPIIFLLSYYFYVSTRTYRYWGTTDIGLLNSYKSNFFIFAGVLLFGPPMLFLFQKIQLGTGDLNILDFDGLIISATHLIAFFFLILPFGFWNSVVITFLSTSIIFLLSVVLSADILQYLSLLYLIVSIGTLFLYWRMKVDAKKNSIDLTQIPLKTMLLNYVIVMLVLFLIIFIFFAFIGPLIYSSGWIYSTN